MAQLRERTPHERPPAVSVSTAPASTTMSPLNSQNTPSGGPASSTSSSTSTLAGASAQSRTASDAANTLKVPRVELYHQLAAALLVLTVLMGTIMSLLSSSASITSFRGRLPAADRVTFHTSRLPGPLSSLDLSAFTPSYFANKRKVLNVIFVKRAWAWTTLVWALHYFARAYAAANDPTRPASAKNTLYRPIRRYAVATMYWLLFTTWFFGPSLSDRVLVYSGAVCVPSSMSSYPSGSVDVPDSGHASTPVNAHSVLLDSSECYQSRPDDVYLPMSNAEEEIAKGASSAAGLAAVQDSNNAEGVEKAHTGGRGVKARPIWKGGHDVSGHCFLLTLSIMTLLTEIAPTLGAMSRASGRSASSSNTPHRPGITHHQSGAPPPIDVFRKGAVYAVLGLCGLWWWMLLMTSLYFHTPQEKVSGIVAGLGAWWGSYMLAR